VGGGQEKGKEKKRGRNGPIFLLFVYYRTISSGREGVTGTGGGGGRREREKKISFAALLLLFLLIICRPQKKG